ncbi:hypothetical protein HYU15_02210 [Candidatus Woesearchaeota archaeon]|nr:hypothetical protein [Candidatus Woesearchaeota archaeon]
MIPGAPNFSAYLATFGVLEARVVYDQELTPPDSQHRARHVHYEVFLNGQSLGFDEAQVMGDISPYRTYQGKAPMPSGEIQEVRLIAECNSGTGLKVKRADMYEGEIPYP